MKYALITDTHWGARNDSKAFLDYFIKFYEELFFPYLKEHDIKNIVMLGDVVDRRKAIDFNTAYNMRTNFFDVCFSMGIHVDIIVGNHDVYHKNTNRINSMIELVCRSYTNIQIYYFPNEILLGGIKTVVIPWINNENREETFELIKNTDADLCIGHLEFAGFEMYKGTVIDEGIDTSDFKKFKMVMSGHYHHRSFKNNILYLGAPYQMTWNDYDDDRGFHVIDTDDMTMDRIVNPNQIFHKIHYDEKSEINDDFAYLENTYVKLYVDDNTDKELYDKFIKAVQEANPHDIQIIERSYVDEDTDIELEQDEDTLSILNKYIDKSEVQVDKKALTTLIQSLYNKAIAAHN